MSGECVDAKGQCLLGGGARHELLIVRSLAVTRPMITSNGPGSAASAKRAGNAPIGAATAC